MSIYLPLNPYIICFNKETGTVKPPKCIHPTKNTHATRKIKLTSMSIPALAQPMIHQDHKRPK